MEIADPLHRRHSLWYRHIWRDRAIFSPSVRHVHDWKGACRPVLDKPCRLDFQQRDLPPAQKAEDPSDQNKDVESTTVVMPVVMGATVAAINVQQ